MADPNPPIPIDPDAYRMSLGDHLDELRRRLIHSLLGVGLALLITLWFGKDIVAWVVQPLNEAQRAAHLPRYVVGHSVTAPLTVYLVVSLISAAIIASPWLTYQLWHFISKGLYARERRGFYHFAPLSALMTLLGVLFTYYLFMPAVLAFLLKFSISFQPIPVQGPSFLRDMSERFAAANDGSMMPLGWPLSGSKTTTAPANSPDDDATIATLSRVPMFDVDPENPVEGQIWYSRAENEVRVFAGGQISVLPTVPNTLFAPQLEIGQYLWFFAITTAVVVVAFQIPVLMLVLSMMRIVSPDTVSQYRKVIVFVLAAACVLILPSQDLFTNVVLPLVMWGLFELGLILMRLSWRERDKEEDIDDQMEESP
jgi:sec-independent protein translocase protein TatC